MPEWLSFLTNADAIIREGGLWLVMLIVFAENGLFFAFFLPGDYLLFLAGVFCGTGLLATSLGGLLAGVIGAAVAGSLVGYLFGRFFGNSLENRRDSLFFKKKHLETTRKYFDKYGSRVLIISRFLPIVRTFAPILSGVSNMNFPHFMLYNVLGGIIWVGLLCSLGYFLGERFPQITHYVHYIILFFLAITTFTVIKGYFNARKEMAEEEGETVK